MHNMLATFCVSLLWILYAFHIACGHYFEDSDRCVWECKKPYDGKLNTTVSGKACRNWIRPRLGLMQTNNICQTQGGKGLPWCYTNQQNWEYCFNQACPQPSRECQDGFMYFSNVCVKVVPLNGNTYASANETCFKQGSYMASSNSHFVLDHFYSLACRPLLLGAKLINDQTTWPDNSVWASDRNLSPWCQNEGEQSGSCVVMTDEKCLKRVDCNNIDKNLYTVCSYHTGDENNPRPSYARESVPVTFYVSCFKDVSSANEEVYYAYSLSREQSAEEFEVDQAPWRHGGYLDGDLRKIVLMSQPVAGRFETAIYFCKTMYVDNLVAVKTWIHKVALEECESPWKLNFKLYGSLDQSNTENKNYWVGNQEYPSHRFFYHSRVSTLEGKNNLYNARLGFGFSGPPTTLSLKATKLTDACSGVEKLHAKRGLIQSPRFPFSYPRDQNMSCKWRIIGEQEDSVIRIKFTHMKLTETLNQKYFVAPTGHEVFRTTYHSQVFNHNQDCKYDYVEVKDPKRWINSRRWRKYGTFCGSWTPSTFLTLNSSVVVNFFTSTQSLGDNFEIRYEVLSPPKNLKFLTIPVGERAALTWQVARRKCQSVNQDLCNANDICRYENRPFYKVAKANKWTPVLDEYNDWLQIGNQNGQTCHRHNKFYGPPEWGFTNGGCDGSDSADPCEFKSDLYCCIADDTQATFEPQLVTVDVYTTVQNGQTYYKYIRQGIDPVTEELEPEIWSKTVHGIADLQSFQLYSGFKRNFEKVLYFCSKTLQIAIGQIRTVYSVSFTPCNSIDWNIEFYLYAATREIADTKKMYVGINRRSPYHSRIKFKSYPLNFDSQRNFYFYAFSSNLIPVNDETEQVTPQTCKSDPIILKAPAIIESPNYPEHYPPDSNCKWIISLTESDQTSGARLRMRIEDLVLESNLDWLLVYDLSNAPAIEDIPNLRTENRTRYTSSVSHTSQITRGVFYLHFKSDATISRRGFRVHADVLADNCGSVISNHATTVSSPGYPNAYVPGTICEWVIKAPGDNFGIDIQFGKFEVLNSTKCVKDKVLIKHKFGEKTLCGIQQQPEKIQVNSKTANVSFVTSNHTGNTLKGFTFTVYFFKSDSGIRTGATCGEQIIRPGSGVQDRIIGGKEAVVGSWPWMAYFENFTCGGAILSNKWILSAGHCFAVENKATGKWDKIANFTNAKVIVGRHEKDIPFPSEQALVMDKVIIHPEYGRIRVGNAGKDKSGIPFNDIALVKLKTHIIYQDNIQPICMPSQDAVSGENCVIAGWGAQGQLAPSKAGVLQYANVPILENSLCNSWEKLRGSILTNMMCAGYPGGGVDSCWGDSGGPLMCADNNGVYHVKGVVSWGKACGEAEQPGIYTRVWLYSEWITNTVN